MADVFIYDHVRTPRGRGKTNGSLHEITPVNLMSQTLRALKERNDLAPDAVDEIVLGCVMAVGDQGATTVRMAPIDAGFADEVPALHVNRFCASGLESIAIGAAKIAAGWADAAIGGGYESMSRPLPSAGGGAWGIDPAFSARHPMSNQGVAADLLATMMGSTREDIDAYSLESQRRTQVAQENGYFDGAIIPVRDILGTVVLDRDEHPRPETTAEGLAALKPAFAFHGAHLGGDAVMLQRYPHLEKINHVHTAGSSSGIVDGASAVLVGNAEFGQRAGLKPRARIRSSVSIGAEPLLFLDAPPAASRAALKRAGMSISDIDLWELNEAFAAVPILLMKELGISHDRLNVNGGAIAMGHPLGATGGMVLGTLLDELERRDLSTGVVGLCAAGGQAISTVIERV